MIPCHDGATFNPDGKTICDTGAEKCVECLTEPDCMTGEVCIDQTCRAGCDSDNDCTPQGLLCFQTGGYCVECVRQQDCGPTEDCVRGSCAPAAPRPEDGGIAPACTPMTCPSCFPYSRCCNAMGECSCNIGLGCL